MLIVIGLITALVVGVVALVVMGEVAAIVALVVIVASAVFASVRGSSTLKRWAVVALGVLLAAGVATGGWIAYGIAAALTDTAGPPATADRDALAAAESKLDETEGEAGFRIELTESELTAVVQDGLPDGGPIRSVTIDLVAGEDGAGRADFAARFKSESLSAQGSTRAIAEAGGVRLELLEVDLGPISSSAVARAAIEDVLNAVVPFNQALAEDHLSVQSVTTSDDRVVITGTSAGGDVITSASLLASLAVLAAGSDTIEPPAERLGPGDVNDVEAPGSTMYLALGDSLAANVGVDEPRDGYVSRFHKQLQLRTEGQLGLRNLGIPGETSGSFILGGQHEEALAVIGSSDVRYVTIDIGANDLLGHLASDDCSNNPSGPRCQARLDDTYASYEANLDRIVADLRDAAPDATIILLQFYNPFSLGLGSGIRAEGASDRAVVELNDIGLRIALAHDLLVADGFTPMSGTTASTTHILDSPPDIHPVAIGYDILASALLDALP